MVARYPGQLGPEHLLLMHFPPVPTSTAQIWKLAVEAIVEEYFKRWLLSHQSLVCLHVAIQDGSGAALLAYFWVWSLLLFIGGWDVCGTCLGLASLEHAITML